MTRTTTTTILLGLLIASAAMPAADANHPNTVCNPMEARHSYTGPGGAYASVTTGPIDDEVRTGGKPITVDLCPTVEGDGENELGIGGGVFPAGTSACADASHHAYSPGAQYWADDETGFAVLVYTAGADGPALVPDATDPCATDGVISDDPWTDPLDCGDGYLGYYSLPSWFSATLEENIPGSGACNPNDGTVWVTVYAGVFVADDRVLASTPVSGHIYS